MSLNTPVEQSRVQLVLHYVICYVALALSSLLALWTMLRWLTAIEYLMLALGADRWVATAVDKAAILVLGLLWLVFVLVAESYFRRGVQRGLLWVRIGKVFGLLTLLLLIAYGIQELYLRSV